MRGVRTAADLRKGPESAHTEWWRDKEIEIGREREEKEIQSFFPATGDDNR